MLKYFLKDTKSYKQHDFTYDENLSIYVQNYIIRGGKIYEEVLDFFKWYSLDSEITGNYFLFYFPTLP